MATIHKRKLTSGEVVWELTHGTGPERQRFVAGKTAEEARDVLRQFKHQLELHGEAPSDGAIDAVIAEYARFLKTNRRPRTVARYLGVLRTFHVCFLERYHPDVQRMREVRPKHIEDYKRLRSEGAIAPAEDTDAREREQELRLQVGTTERNSDRKKNAKFGFLGRHQIRRRVSPKTINYELQTLCTFCSWAIKRNHLFLNPTSIVERFRIPKRALPKFMTAEDLKKFFAACTEDDRRLYMTILLTGMRKGEVEHLLWSDISLELGVIFVQAKTEEGLEWQPKTDERIIPISPVLQNILLEQFERRRSDRFVFANENGNRDTHILERLKRYCEKAGIKQSTVHALRHSFGAHLRMAGVSLADIGDLLGHKDLATTQIYAKVHQEHLRAAIAKLAPLASSTTSTALPETTSPRSAKQLTE